MEENIYVTPEMLTGDIVLKFPEAAIALMECGMGCVSCPASAAESLRDASLVHGLDPEEVINYVNRRLNEMGVDPAGVQMND